MAESSKLWVHFKRLGTVALTNVPLPTLLSVASLVVSAMAFMHTRSSDAISLRAYLSINDPKATYGKTGKLDGVEVVIRNLGNTPATHVEISYLFTDAEDGRGKQVPIHAKTYVGDLAPKDEFDDPESFAAPDAIFTANKSFSYLTTVRYLDAFRNRHSLQICWDVDGTDVGQCEVETADEQ